MAKVSQEFIDNLLARTDIVEQINSRVPLRKMGKNLTASCPFHHENTPSFVVFTSTQVYHCFGCGAHGSVIRFLMDYDRMTFIDAIKHLSSLAGLTIPVDSTHEKVDQYDDLYKVLAFAANFYRNNLAKNSFAVAYLNKRKISLEIGNLYQLGFALDEWRSLSALMIKKSTNQAKMAYVLEQVGLAIKKDQHTLYDRFRNRLIFPIHDIKGRVVGFGGRVLDDSKPKYLNSPETILFHKGNELYGLYQITKNTRSLARIIIVEGYMDVISLAQHGVDNAVAVLGTAISASHLQRIFRLTTEVVYCFDGDFAGQQAANRAFNASLPLMADGRSVKFLFLPKGHDPDSFIVAEGRDKFLQLVTTAKSLDNYLFSIVAEKVEGDDIASRACFVELSLALILKIPAGVYQTMLISALAQKAQIDEKYIRDKISHEKNGEVINQAIVKEHNKQKTIGGKIRLNLLGRISSILLQNPHMASLIPDNFVAECKIFPAHEVFLEIYATIKNNQGVSSSYLADCWHGKEYSQEVAILMTSDLHISGIELQQELKDILARLQAKIIKYKRKESLSKLTDDFARLSIEHKNKIRDMLQTDK